jgi:hypothetical protein
MGVDEWFDNEYSTKYRAEIIETIVTSPTITRALMKGL